MANTLTIQLRPTKKYSAPSIANLIHNAGLAKATYWLKEAKGNIKNKYTIPSVKKAIENWRWWEHFAKEIILQKKNRKPLKNQILIEEGLMIIGKDVPKKDPKIFIEIFKEFANWFEEKYKTQILFWSFHNHEGHLDQEGEFSENLHIHFFFLNVDKEGNSVRRQIKKTDLSYFQSKIYEIGKKYIPTLERATNYKELGLKAPKHLSHREFRTKKVKETQLNLAPKIQAIKKENKKLKEENKELLARVKDLKEENKRIREQFKELGAVREDYARLEQLNKELKDKIKAKDLTIEKMKKEFNKQLEELKEEQEKNKQLNDENGELYRENYALINELDEEKRKNEELESIIRGFFELELNRTKEEKEQLKEELKEKDKEIKALKELAYSKKYTYSDTKKPVLNVEVVEYLEKKLNNKEKKIEELQKKLLQSENIVKQLQEENKKLKEELERLKEEIKKETKENAKVRGYTAFDEFYDSDEVTKLYNQKIIKDVDRTDDDKLIIYTYTFSLKEQQRNEFEIDKQKPLNEEEIEKAILILIKVRHWDIGNIRVEGSQSFIEKANRVIKRLKEELKGEQKVKDIGYKPIRGFKP